MDSPINAVSDEIRIRAQELLRALELDIREVVADSGEDIRSVLDAQTVASVEERAGESIDKIDAQELLELLSFGHLIKVLCSEDRKFQPDTSALAIAENASDVAQFIELRNGLFHHRESKISPTSVQHLWETVWALFECGFSGSRTKEQMRAISRTLLVDRDKSRGDKALHNLPAQDYGETGFVGRQQLIRKITDSLKKPPTASGTFMWLVGPGGVGKSALALEVAYRMMHSEKFELIFWASFKPGEFTDSGVQPILGSLQEFAELPRAIEGSIAGTQNLASLEEVWRALEGTPTLIVLDNCESLESDQFIRILESDPPLNVRFLLTSRTHGAIGLPHRVPDFTDDECRKFIGKLGRVFDSSVLLDVARSDERLQSLLSKTGRTPLAIKWVARRCARGDLLDDILASQGALFDYCAGAEFRELSSVARQVVEMLHESKDWTSTSDLVSLIGSSIESLQIAMRELNDRMFLDQRSGDGITTQFRLNETVENFLKYSTQVDVLQGVQYRRKIRALRQHGSQNEFAKRAKGYFSPYFVDRVDDTQNSVTARLYACLGARQRQGPEELQQQLRMVRSLQESAPRYWEVYRVGAHLLYWQGKMSDAIEDMRRAVELAPVGRAKARCLGFLAQMLGEFDDQESLEVAKQAFVESPEWDTKLAMGRRSYFAGLVDEAISILEEMYNGSTDESERYVAASELAKAYQRGSQIDRKSQEDRDMARRYAKDGLLNLLQCYELRFLTREYLTKRGDFGTHNSARMVEVHLEMFSRFLIAFSENDYVENCEFLDRVIDALANLGARSLHDVVSDAQIAHSGRVANDLFRSIREDVMTEKFRNFIVSGRVATDSTSSR